MVTPIMQNIQTMSKNSCKNTKVIKHIRSSTQWTTTRKPSSYLTFDKTQRSQLPRKIKLGFTVAELKKIFSQEKIDCDLEKRCRTSPVKSERRKREMSIGQSAIHLRTPVSRINLRDMNQPFKGKSKVFHRFKRVLRSVWDWSIFEETS